MVIVQHFLFVRKRTNTPMNEFCSSKHHPFIEEVTEVLSHRTQNKDKPFFRILATYYLFTVVATMGAKLISKERGEVPVNGYAVALSPSGTGKGFSTNLLETHVCQGFRKSFIDHTMPILAEQNMWTLARRRAAMKNTNEDEELLGLEKEYRETGAFTFDFDSGTVPALKQIRQKILLSGTGSINFQVDEIGLNLSSIADMLHAYLELYDQGLIKEKLIKNTNDNKRNAPLVGKTPTNMLLFGTPTRLFDGGSTEDHFYSLLDTGYARRSFFAYGNPIPASENETPSEIYDNLIDQTDINRLNKWSSLFTDLADPAKNGWRINVPRNVSELLIAYQSHCKKLSKKMPEFEVIRQAEMSHRYFKAYKLAGAFAFIDEDDELTEKHLRQAIKLTEESGEAFQKIFKREKSYMKLARYIAGIGAEVTHADLFEALPFYKQGNAARQELLTMAAAWGYRQHIILKKTYIDGIEFFSGETLKETNLEEMTFSYSQDFARDYVPEVQPFNKLHKLITAPGHHWTNHRFKDKHRTEANALPGFNMIVLDVDGTFPMQQAQDLLKEYVWLMHTTKRHTEDANRYRIILPMNYELKLDKTDYRQFMDNISNWLPFKLDEETFQRSRKWMTNNKAKYEYSKGAEVLDILQFVPKTSKNEKFTEANKPLASLTNLERWFASRISDGNRNNQLAKYAFALMDSGMKYPDIEAHVLEFNSKLQEPLPEDELRKTVLTSVARKINQNP